MAVASFAACGSTWRTFYLPSRILQGNSPCLEEKSVIWLFVTKGEKRKLGFLKPLSCLFFPGVIRMEAHTSNVVVPTFLQETDEVFEAGCSFYLGHQFLIRVKDIWKGPSRGTVSAELFASLGEQEQSSQSTICDPNMLRVAGKSIWGPRGC